MAKVYAGSRTSIDEIRDELAQLREEVQLLRASRPVALAPLGVPALGSGETASPGAGADEAAAPKDHHEASSSLFSVENIAEESAEIVVEPNSFHMIAIHCFLDQRATRRERWTAFGLSFGMVALQVGALCAVVMGSGGSQTCTANEDCLEGRMCATIGMGKRTTSYCSPCFSGSSLSDESYWTGKPTALAPNPGKDCFDATTGLPASNITDDQQAICDRCYDGSEDKKIEFLNELYTGGVKRMMIGDWANLLLASIVVSLTVVGELRDTLALRVKIEKAWSADHNEAFIPPKKWYYLCLFLNATRWYIFLPLLCTTVPYLVWSNGSDALSICMNTIAVTFLVDLDNMVYDMGLEESTRQRVAEEGAGVTLNHKDEEVIILAKYFHGAGCVLLMLVFTVSPFTWRGTLFGFQLFFGLGGILTELNWFSKYQGRPTPLAAIKIVSRILCNQWVPSFCAMFFLMATFPRAHWFGLLYEQPAGR